jgi:hypothetical protein
MRRTMEIDVDLIHGRYGEFKVLVDGSPVVDAGPLAALGVLPSRRQVAEQVRASLAAAPARTSAGGEG